MYKGFYSFFFYSTVLLILLSNPIHPLFSAMFMLSPNVHRHHRRRLLWAHEVGCGKTNFIVYTVSVLPYCWFRMNYLYLNSSSKEKKEKNLKDDGLSVYSTHSISTLKGENNTFPVNI